MSWPPSRAQFLLCLATGSSGYFLVGTIIGLHPDGAILGFSAAIWAAWDNEVVQQRKRRQRRYRRGSDHIIYRRHHEQPDKGADEGQEED